MVRWLLIDFGESAVASLRALYPSISRNVISSSLKRPNAGSRWCLKIDLFEVTFEYLLFGSA